MSELAPKTSTPDIRDILDATATKDFLTQRGIRSLTLENWSAPRSVLFVLQEDHRKNGYQDFPEHKIPTIARLKGVTFPADLPAVLASKAPQKPETVEFTIKSSGVVDYFVIPTTGEPRAVKHNEPAKKEYVVTLENLYPENNELFNK